jgi:hypothetical protein
MSSTVCFSRILSVFFLEFWSQIYAHPSTSDWHMPPSCIPRRLPSLLPKVLVVWIAGARRVVLMRQGVFALWLRMKATFRLFRPCLVASEVYDVRSAAMCLWHRRVYTRRRSDEVCHFLHCRRLVLRFFLPLCLCIPLIFQVQFVFVLLKFY